MTNQDTIAGVKAKHHDKIVGWTLQDIGLLVMNPAHVAVIAEGHQLRVQLTDAGRDWIKAEMDRRVRDAFVDLEHAICTTITYGSVREWSDAA